MTCACVNQSKVETNNVKVGTIQDIKGISGDPGSNPNINNTGKDQEASWQGVAMTAVAGIATVAAFLIAKKQYAIAEEYLGIAEERWSRFEKTYMPCEKKALLEASLTPKYKKRYNERGTQYKRNVHRAFTIAKGRLSFVMDAMSMPIHASSLRRIDLFESVARIDAVEMAWRYEDYLWFLYDDLRVNRRAGILNAGKNLLANSAEAARNASNAYGDIKGEIASASGGAIRALGYFNERNPIQQPVKIDGQTGTSSVDTISLPKEATTEVCPVNASVTLNNGGNWLRDQPVGKADTN